MSNKLLCASILASVAAVSTTAYADYSVSTLAGYQFTPENTQKHQVQDVQGASNDSGTFGIGVNMDVTDKLNTALEWTTVRAHGTQGATDVDSNMYSINARYKVIPSLNLSVLGGIGFAQTTTKYVDAKANTQDSPVLQLGLSHKQSLTDKLALRSDAKAVYNTNSNYWNPQILFGLEYKIK